VSAILADHGESFSAKRLKPHLSKNTVIRKKKNGAKHLHYLFQYLKLEKYKQLNRGFIAKNKRKRDTKVT
jgi:hypothetical protein